MRIILGTILIMFFSVTAFADQTDTYEGHEKEDNFNPVPVILEHISDAHSWHLWGGEEDAVSIPLPVILWANNSLLFFMSSEFHHDIKGHHVVSKNGLKFVNYEEKIYQLDDNENEVKFNKNKEIENASRPIDISLTRNVCSMFLSVLILSLVFIGAAKNYRGGVKAPKGIASFMEPFVLFIKNDIALQNIGKKHHERFLPFLLTVFFFIWFNNLIGLIPFFPFGSNLTGNIAVTLVLAIFTFVLTTINGNKQYWGHILWMPGVPAILKILIITPIEIVGIIIKPFALMIRLFANITAGHIVVLSLVSLIFVFKSIYMSAVAVPFTLFISVLELLVALLQAYVFTMLSALFIGSALAEHH